MDARTARFFAAQSLALFLAACGPQSVRPTDDGGSDGGADGAAATDSGVGSCAAPRVLLEADSTRVTNVAYARALTGWVEVTASREGALSARVFDRQWQPVGAAVDLPSMQPLAATEAKTLTVSFLDDRGVVSYGSSVHELTIDAALSLRLDRTLQAVADGRAFNLVGAWPRRTPTNTIATSAVAMDGSEWSASATELWRQAQPSAMIEPLSFTTDVQFVGDSTEYIAFETLYRRDINNDVRVRKFITGHGVLVQSSSRTEPGTTISPVVRVGDELWRLHYHRNEMVGVNDTQLSLVRHDAVTGEQRSATALSEAGLPLSGAIAATEGGASTLLVWSREVGSSSQPAAILVQRATGAPTELYRSTLSMSVLGAWIDESSNRRWVSFATYTRESTPRRTVYVQCVE